MGGGGVNIPDDFHCLHHFVTPLAGIFFVDGVAFLMTLSRKIRLTTVEHVPGHRDRVLTGSLEKILRICIRKRRIYGQFNTHGPEV